MPEPGLPPGFVQEQRAEAFLTEVTISGQRGGDAQVRASWPSKCSRRGYSPCRAGLRIAQGHARRSPSIDDDHDAVVVQDRL